MTALLSCSKKMTMILNKVINGKEYTCQIFADGVMNIFDSEIVFMCSAKFNIDDTADKIENRFTELVLNQITPLPL